MRRTRGLLVTIFVLLLGVGLATAHEIQQGDQCVIEAGRIVESNLFVLCRSLLISGEIRGNVIGAATTATITGTVNGDLYLIAGSLDVSGVVSENIHFAGPVLRLHSDAQLVDSQADLISFSLSTTLEEGSVIPGSVISLGYQLLSEGTVGRELSFWGSSLHIAGEVGGNVDAQVGDAEADVSQLETLLIPVPLDITLQQPGLWVQEGAFIKGRLSYSGPTEATIEGNVAQEPIYRPVVVQPDFTQLAIADEDPGRGLALYLTQAIREFLAVGFVGVIGLLLLPRAMQAPLRNLQTRPLVCLGVGMLSFIMAFVLVFAAILLTILIVIIISLFQINELTIGVGTFLSFVDIGGASFLFIVVIFVSRVIFSLAIGRILVRLFYRDADFSSLRTLFITLALGTAILALLVAIPLAGWIFNGVAAFLGLGALLTLLQARAERAREAATAPRIQITSPPRRPGDESSPRLIPPPPPPIIDSAPRPLGMDNLPEGFTWWDD